MSKKMQVFLCVKIKCQQLKFSHIVDIIKNAQPVPHCTYSGVSFVFYGFICLFVMWCAGNESTFIAAHFASFYVL